MNLKDSNERADYYIVPGKKVADFVRKSHAGWLSAPSKSGKPRKDGSMRKREDPNQEYLEKWDLLAL